MAAHSSILAWEIPWTEEPDGLQSMGSLGTHAKITCSCIVALGSPSESIALGSLSTLLGLQWLPISLTKKTAQSGSKFNKRKIFPSRPRANFHSRFNNNSALGNMLKTMAFTLYIWKKIILFGPKVLERDLFNKFMAKCSLYFHRLAKGILNNPVFHSFINVFAHLSTQSINVYRVLVMWRE